ncbi:hypothetical protein I302_102241 [Kwoniella bestiolae CBS 10118]|uniref:Uncharacterized protein n=1 Tax=Kwoniella bestiolae CBS 10118 TaxID=1296100 RepID=A0A1B9GEK9_9TREE|nr:hypothetical protein I302_00930 [Kwoniella bestiolae CBS 10118]OCF29425.1 hypothetical protein I302_00930 [Kwoniella bestiolae CBS 10118]
MSANKQEDFWRTPSPDSEVDDDVDISNMLELPGGGDILKDLDLTQRKEDVKFVDTPWTIANRRARYAGVGGERKTGRQVTADESSSNPPPRPAVPPAAAAARQSAPPPTRPLPITAKSQPAATAKPIPQPKASTSRESPVEEPEIIEVVKPKKVRNSGWYDPLGNPIPKSPPRKRTIDDKLNDHERAEEKKKLRYQKAAATRARNKAAKEAAAKAEQEKNSQVKFSVLPPDAAPNEEFPILRLLEKMKELPTKEAVVKGKGKKKGKGKAKHEEEDDNASAGVGPKMLDKLIRGKPGSSRNDKDDGKEEEERLKKEEEQKPPTASETREKERIQSMEDIVRLNSERTAREYRNTNRIAWTRPRTNPKTSTMKPTNEHEDHEVASLKDDSVSSTQPSTITHLPSSIIRDIEKVGQSSSDVLPYSSPLDRYSKKPAGLLEPRPKRQGEQWTSNVDVEILEKAAEEGTNPDYYRSIMEEDSPEEPQDQLQTPQTSSVDQRHRFRGRSNTALPSSNPFSSSSLYRSNAALLDHMKRTSPPVDTADGWKEEDWSSSKLDSLGAPAAKRSKKNSIFQDKAYSNKIRTPRNFFPVKIAKSQNHEDDMITDPMRTSSRLGSSLKADSVTRIDDGNGGIRKLSIFTPTPKTLDETQQKIYSTITSKGDKYGGSGSSGDPTTRRYNSTGPQQNSRLNNGFGNARAGPSNGVTRSFTNGGPSYTARRSDQPHRLNQPTTQFRYGQTLNGNLGGSHNPIIRSNTNGYPQSQTRAISNGYQAPAHRNGTQTPAHSNGYRAPAHSNGYSAPPVRPNGFDQSQAHSNGDYQAQSHGLSNGPNHSYPSNNGDPSYHSHSQDLQHMSEHNTIPPQPEEEEEEEDWTLAWSKASQKKARQEVESNSMEVDHAY